MYINRCAGRVHSSPCTGIRSTHVLSRFSCCARGTLLLLPRNPRAHVASGRTTRRLRGVPREKKKSTIGLAKPRGRLPLSAYACYRDRLTRNSAILSIFLDANYVRISHFVPWWPGTGEWSRSVRHARRALLIFGYRSAGPGRFVLCFWTWASDGNPAGYWKASIHGGSGGGSGLGRRSKMRDKELIAAFGNGPGLTGGNKFYYQIFLRLYAPRS